MNHQLYGVKTTGIYCRTGCPSRQPKEENLVYFDTSAEARAAGYRACKRCNPDGSPPEDDLREKIEAACRRIETSDPPPPIRVLAAEAHYSPSHFRHLFQRITGLTPAEYARSIKFKRFRESVSNTVGVTDAIFAAGFGSTSRLYEKRKQRLAMSPTALRRGGENETIRCSVHSCTMGYVSIARTELGICSIELGESPEEVLGLTKARFPSARIETVPADADTLARRVVKLIDDGEAAPELPLDIRGTLFQEKVWKALASIPEGSTASYGEIAALIGQPQAARAVANACGTNPLAVVIPCHRAIRQDGTSGGYRWGTERKRALLEREKPD